MMNFHRNIKYILYLSLIWIGIFSAIKLVYNFQFKSKVVTLVQANLSMRNYQGMNFDLTGLGPFVIFNLERSDDFEVSYIRLIDGKSIFERNFEIQGSNRINSMTTSFEEDGMQVEVSAVMTFRATVWLVILSSIFLAIMALTFFYLKLLIERRRSIEISSLARQVAHDIRSPLEAIKVLREELVGLPTDSRRFLQLSINRIEEIIYNLLKFYDDEIVTDNDVLGPEEILSLLENILMEKRLEYSSYEELEFISHFDSDSYGLFSILSRGELKRILSNLINNAVDSIPNQNGKIFISLYSTEDKNIIKIVDTGVGISADLREKIFVKGFTTKKAGSGLGLSSARSKINSFGGTLNLESEVGKGTSVEIFLPKVDQPKNFISKIDLHKYQKIVIVDDDRSFHDLWKKKFQIFEERIESYYSAKDLYQKYKELPEETLLLCDFELLNDSCDGIDVIIKYHKKDSSILTTARSEERSIQKRCLREGVPLLPKNVISHVVVNTSRLN